MAPLKNETIYDILYQPPPTPLKSPRYQATMRFEVSGKVPLKPFATMGPAELIPDAPNQFLKKGEGLHSPPKESQAKKCLSSKRLPPLPKPENKNKGNRSLKNFKAENIKQASQSMTNSGGRRSVVDSSDGHKYGLDHYGLKYVFRGNYGQVPNYLMKKKRILRKMEEEYENQVQDKEVLCNQITKEERDALLNGLKKNREELQKKFLLLPVLIDTIPKVNKKQKLEQQLRELEKDIEMLEKHPYIYIAE